MNRHRIEGIVEVDQKTGELTLQVRSAATKRHGRRFLKLYQDEMVALAERHPELRGGALRVLNLLVGVGDYQNRVPGPSRVATRLAMQVSNVSRAYGELVKAGALIKRGGDYYVNPRLCWKGTDAQLEETYRLLAAEDQRALPAPKAEVR